MVSVWAIVGWFFHVELLTRLHLDFPSMKFKTALGYIFVRHTMLINIKYYDLGFTHVINSLLMIIGRLTPSQDIFSMDQTRYQ
ncbi:MAG TPA: hypothetical protein DEF18_16080 [Muricauda sp.]|nr:hypothetical protein [Allomuricauda sp.]MBC72498.1 hypothetical protein [Allomuricauda sp.]HBU79617.1 hypothetical protein [Allomuricauda sp.]|tara:strand:- start:11940 stop:12188 length:249 start_codon:yes stop_codon:yes gene_type:complete